jgi:hypothetical protein
MRTEFVGASACQGIPSAEPTPEVEPHLAEVMMRIGVRSNDRAAIERFTKELAPLALNGPPVVTGFGSGRPKVEEIVAYWPALIPKREVAPEVTLWPNEN